MALQRIKRIPSHSGHARFLAECADLPLGVIPRQADIPSPYAYSPDWLVYDWQGQPVTIRETAHRRYDVFAVPREMILPLAGD